LIPGWLTFCKSAALGNCLVHLYGRAGPGSELDSDVMFLAAKFTPQRKVVQDMCENEDVHDAISKTEACR